MLMTQGAGCNLTIGAFQKIGKTHSRTQLEEKILQPRSELNYSAYLLNSPIYFRITLRKKYFLTSDERLWGRKQMLFWLGEKTYFPFIEASCKIYNVSMPLVQEYVTSDIQKTIAIHSTEICHLNSHIFFRHLMMKKII